MSLEGRRGVGQWVDGGSELGDVRIGRVSYVF